MSLKTAIVPFSELGDSWSPSDHICLRNNGMKLRQWERLQEITRLRSKYRTFIAKLDAEEREIREEIEGQNLV